MPTSERRRHVQRNRRSAIVVSLALALFVGGACASPTPAAPDPAEGARFVGAVLRARPHVDPQTAADVAEARRFAAFGCRAEAFRRLLRVAAEHPDDLEAERALQDLLAGTRSDAWLRRRAQERLAARPGDADANYLAARIEPDRVRQAALFDAAIAADPGHPWARLGRALVLERSGRPDDAIREAWRVIADTPWFSLPWTYLGQTALARGAPQAAERFLLEAVARGADDPRPWAVLAAAYDEMDQGPDAARTAIEALRRSPADGATTFGLARILERRGSPDELAAAVRVAEEVRPACGDTAPLDLLRGRVLVAAGRWDEAIAALLAAIDGGAAPGDVAVPLRRARVGAGRAAEAVAEYLAALPESSAPEGDTRAPVRAELLAAARAWTLDDPRSAARLVTAMRAAGWNAESRQVLTLARDRRPADAELLRLSAEADAFAGFLAELGACARDLRRRSRRGEIVPLDETLDRLRGIAIARLGRDASDGVRVTHHPFLGAFATSHTSGGTFRDVFEGHGLLIVAGARSGRSAELLVGRIVADRPGARATVLGEEIAYDEHWIESDGLPDGLAGIRSGMAGLTLDRTVLLQLDVIRHAPSADEADLPYVAVEATDDAALRSLATPSRVAARIERAVGGRDPRSTLALDAVLRHERVHVLDASRMLPVFLHPLRNLAFAARHGFSGAAIESTLEARAAVASIVDAEDPCAALAPLLAFLPAESGETAHVTGYHAAVAAAVDAIVSDPAAFPSIDLRWNVVQQMDRLGPAEVRELARRVLARID